MITIIIVLIVLLLMSGVLFLLLKMEVTDINNKSKVYFTRKIQEYTDYISQEKQLNIDKKEEKVVDKKEKEEKKSTVIYVEKKANYEIDDLLKLMKKIDEDFQINNIDIIKAFLREYVVDDDKRNKKYQSLLKMKKLIDSIGIYNIITKYEVDDYEELVSSLKLINHDLFMEFFSGRDDFSIEDFSDYLNYEIGKSDPTIYIYVGNRKLNYDTIDKRIRTLYSDEIYKGLKIIYLNKLYDYSLS